MAKIKTAFYCQNCGAQFSKWQGQCTSCKQWNTIAEEIIQKPDKKEWKNTSTPSAKRIAKPVLVKEIKYEQEERLDTNDKELNRVLGGGLVHGSLTLLGGEPGIGKSKLLLQIDVNYIYRI